MSTEGDKEANAHAKGRSLAPRLLRGFALCLLGTASLARAEYFIYQEADGTRWLTDHRLGGQQYRLVGKYGRPTATKSCHGVTHKTLEHRAKPHMAVLQEYADQYELDPLLVKAVITVESCFDTHAVSRVGAKGLMQLMPATAETLGVYNVFSARDNIRGGTRYLSEMLQRYQQNTQLALAAYNAGPKAVDKYGGIPPYQETQKYVKRVLNHYERYRTALGLNNPAPEPVEIP